MTTLKPVLIMHATVDDENEIRKEMERSGATLRKPKDDD